MMDAGVAKELYDGVYSRRVSRPLMFATDRYSDYDLGSTLGSISYISKKDSARHIQIIKRSLDQHPKTCLSILDVGCGTGGYLQFLSGAVAASGIGVDVSPVAIDSARRLTRSNPDICFLVGAAQELPIADGAVAAALTIDTLHLIEERRMALSDIHRVLGLQGILVFTVLHTGVNAERVIQNWVNVVESAGFVMVSLRDLSEAWRGHTLAKHAWRWSRRQRLRRVLGSWIEPDLKVSSAMLGKGDQPSVAKNTVRFEFVARKI